ADSAEVFLILISILILILLLIEEGRVRVRLRVRERVRVRHNRGSWSHCMGTMTRGLSMNLAWERWRPAGLFCPSTRKRRLAGKMPALPAKHVGSWSQCVRKSDRGLSMNLAWERWRPVGVFCPLHPEAAARRQDAGAPTK